MSTECGRKERGIYAAGASAAGASGAGVSATGASTAAGASGAGAGDSAAGAGGGVGAATSSGGAFLLRFLVYVSMYFSISFQCVAWFGTATDPEGHTILLAFEDRWLAAWQIVTEDFDFTALHWSGLFRDDDTIRRVILSAGALKSQNEHKAGAV